MQAECELRSLEGVLENTVSAPIFEDDSRWELVGTSVKPGSVTMGLWQ